MVLLSQVAVDFEVFFDIAVFGIKSIEREVGEYPSQESICNVYSTFSKPFPSNMVIEGCRCPVIGPISCPEMDGRGQTRIMGNGKIAQMYPLL